LHKKIIMFFKTGDKVVCIDDRKDNVRIDQDFQNWIEDGKEYVIRGTSMDLKGDQGVLLVEIHNKPIYIAAIMGKAEPRFASIRFRKIEKEDLFIEEEVEEEMYN